MNQYFTTEKKDDKIHIVNNMACHIDGEPFIYEQNNENDANVICELLNDLQQESITLHDIMTIIHNIKYSDWKIEDLLDYVYGGVNIDEIYARYDDIAKALLEMI